MRSLMLTMIVLLFFIAIGCTALPPKPTTIPTILPTKQPEPARPRVGGEISGVSEGTLVTVHIRTPNGWEAHTIKGPFPGLWESVVTEASGTDYIVTAETEGYISQPISYTIYISGDTAYVVRDGEVIDEEAIHLDFHFKPNSP
ncbi:MAG TPA: hypothetical protein PK832_14185 [Anaerolineae bacterium]|nr:hypothetical protein [Anaerolineae bacterium]